MTSGLTGFFDGMMKVEHVPIANGLRCAGAEQNGFYVYPEDSEQLSQSLSKCRPCPIREDCLKRAVDMEETGVWGGEYLIRGRRGSSSESWPFQGRRSVRTQSVDEMFTQEVEEDEEWYRNLPEEDTDPWYQELKASREQ